MSCLPGTTAIYTVNHQSDSRFVGVTLTQPTSGNYSVKYYTHGQSYALPPLVGPVVSVHLYTGTIHRPTFDVSHVCSRPAPPSYTPREPTPPSDTDSSDEEVSVTQCDNTTTPVTPNKKRAWTATTICAEDRPRKQASNANDADIVSRIQELKTASETSIVTIKVYTGKRTTESTKQPKKVYSSISGSIRNMEKIVGTVNELLASARLVRPGAMGESLSAAISALETLCNAQSQLRNLLMQKYHLGRAAVIKVRNDSGAEKADSLEEENDAFLCEMYMSCSVNFRLICLTLSGELKHILS